jgi:hypothetical protein
VTFKISLEKARQSAKQKQQSLETSTSQMEQDADQSEPKVAQKQKANNSAPYRTPEFVWSRVHIRLLDDLLTYIEKVVESWVHSLLKQQKSL